MPRNKWGRTFHGTTYKWKRLAYDDSVERKEKARWACAKDADAYMIGFRVEW